MAFINTDTDAYPVTRETIEAAFPGVIWADANPPAPYKLVLEALSPPTPDADEVLVEGAPELISGVWRQTWTVEDAPVPRVMDRYRWMTALQTLGGTAIVFAAVDSLGPGNASYIYFHETPYFDRDDAKYDAVETMLGATEANTDEVFDLAFTLPLPA